METYVFEYLDQGYIRPFTSLFFVKKKDVGLRPCIDYRGINPITVRYSYPLPVIASAIESMHRARFFTKLDLRGAYNLVRIGRGTSRRWHLVPSQGTMSTSSCRTG
jgi:hypothetical protein